MKIFLSVLFSGLRIMFLIFNVVLKLEYEVDESIMKANSNTKISCYSGTKKNCKRFMQDANDQH